MTDSSADSGNVTDFFDRLGGRPAPAAPAAPALVSSKDEYRAAVPFLDGEERLRLTTHYSERKKEHWAYHLLTNVLMDGPGYVGLLFTTGGVAIEGEHLDALFDDFQGNRGNWIKALIPFDADRYREPAPGAPKITRLEWRRAAQLLQDFEG